MKDTLDRWFGNTPWWMLSGGIHAVLLLGAALVCIEQVNAVDYIVCDLGFRKTTELLPDIERPRDVLDNKPEAPIDSPSTDILDEPFFNPAAVLAKKNESADNNPARELRGDLETAFSWKPGDAPGIKGSGHAGPGVNDSMGVGGGDGYTQRKGRKGTGGMIDSATGIGSTRQTKQTESAVTAALRWLARHQNADGSWGAENFGSRCAHADCAGKGENDYDTGVTGLAVLAFLGAGYTPVSQDDKDMIDPAFPGQQLHFGPCVRDGLKWLIARQDPEGCVGERGQKYLYNHAIGALALSEAFGMTGSQILRDPAQKAIDFLVAAQNPGKGWRYSARGGDNDTSVTGWAVMALKSAELSNLHPPAAAYKGAMNWLEEATDKSGYYRVGYTQAGTGKVFVPGKNEQFADHPSMSAVSVLSRIFIQKSQREPALTAAGLLAADLPAWKPQQVDFYYWYYASLALFQYDGPNGALWKKWNEPMKAALLPNQAVAKQGCANGSWDPSVDRWGFEGGRVYATAINCLTLEVYYRYAHVFGAAASK